MILLRSLAQEKLLKGALEILGLDSGMVRTSMEREAFYPT